MFAAGGGTDPGFQFGVGGVLLVVFGTIVVGLITLAGVIYAARQSRGAQDKTAEIEERRVKVEEQQQRHSELRDYTDRVERDLREARAALAETHRENDRRSDAQAARCAAALSSAMDTVHVLQRVVRDEIAAAAAEVAIDEALEHTTSNHPPRDDTPEGQRPPHGP